MSCTGPFSHYVYDAVPWIKDYLGIDAVEMFPVNVLRLKLFWGNNFDVGAVNYPNHPREASNIPKFSLISVGISWLNGEADEASNDVWSGQGGQYLRYSAADGRLCWSEVVAGALLHFSRGKVS